jgi:hypothetical protein
VQGSSTFVLLSPQRSTESSQPNPKKEDPFPLAGQGPSTLTFAESSQIAAAVTISLSETEGVADYVVGHVRGIARPNTAVHVPCMSNRRSMEG